MKATAVGLSRDLAPRRVMRADVDAQDVALWRGPEGELHAWGNRCPHRGMRLSHGFVRGDKLACLYHGWHYGKDGGCAYIPAHPDLEPPATIAAEVYSVTEVDGVIWASTGAEVAVPSLGAEMTPLRSISVLCAPKDALAAFKAEPFGGEVPVAVSEAVVKVGGCLVAFYASSLEPDMAMVHLCVEAPVDLVKLKALSRWCEAARLSAERPAL